MSFPKLEPQGTLVFLVGVRGAGKSTLIDALRGKPGISVLKPSTTRKPRGGGDEEYHFSKDWQSEQMAWEISVGDEKYGMLKSELAKLKESPFAVTVFDPASIEELRSFRRESDCQVLTVGLDTIQTVEDQNARVGGDKSRCHESEEFEALKDVVINCDVLLKGGPQHVLNGALATFECLRSRGGVIPKTLIKDFLSAGVLLSGASEKVSPASYDLRLGDDVWCQGEFISLSEKNPTLKIPAYSYAIVSSVEFANLPSFMSARFDLKNSLFFRGVILSNGPQIDPGYRGALFCMLYNGSDQPVGITRGTHFATIEFITTAGFDLGYRDKYQGKTLLSDFMPSDAAASEGGKILERTENKIKEIHSEWKNFRTVVYGLIALIVSPAIIVYFNATSKWEEAKAGADAKVREIERLELRMKLMESELALEVERVRDMLDAEKHTREKLSLDQSQLSKDSPKEE